jgi:hypothetical protein
MKLGLGATIVLALGLPAAASAQQGASFFVEVPVVLNNLRPEIVHFEVDCVLQRPVDSPGYDRIDELDQMNGYQLNADGSFDGNLKFEFDNPSLTNAEKLSVTGVRCELFLRTATGGGRMTPSVGNSSVVARAAAGTDFVQIVVVPIPPQGGLATATRRFGSQRRLKA